MPWFVRSIFEIPRFCATDSRVARLGLALGVAAGIAATVGLVPSRSALAAEKYIEGIAAQVGTDIVLASEVMELSAPVEERMREAGAPESEVQKVRRDALERLIEGKLLSSVVERLELAAGREEVDSAITAIAEDNGLSMEQLLASVTSHGLAVEEYRGKIKAEIERSKVVNAMVRSRVQLENDEVKALYDERFGKQREGGEEVYVRHILVMPDGRTAKSPEAACQAIRSARGQIEGGSADFASVARQVSDMNPERGGDLGWIHREDLAGWMSEPIGKMQPGQLSDAIQMPFGCNLLQLVDRRGFEPVSYEQAESQLRNFLFQQKTEVEYTKWLDVLRGQTFIERKGAFGG